MNKIIIFSLVCILYHTSGYASLEYARAYYEENLKNHIAILSDTPITDDDFDGYSFGYPQFNKSGPISRLIQTVTGSASALYSTHPLATKLSGEIKIKAEQYRIKFPEQRAASATN